MIQHSEFKFNSIAEQAIVRKHLVYDDPKNKRKYGNDTDRINDSSELPALSSEFQA